MPGRPAIFLDRDGTLNELALNPASGEWESPHSAAETRLVPDFGQAVQLLRSTGWPLFVVSNQPSVAKGKCSFEDLRAVHNVVAGAFTAAGLEPREWYYCYHHPQGVVPELTRVCECRKPGTLFLRQAQAAHGLDLAASWFIGDQDFDVLCAQAAGCRSVLILNKDSAAKRKGAKADFEVPSLSGAVSRILEAL
jgi:D-glycero-D-manno-heptose 1,7-bisphosphate phosphatase